MDWKAYLQLIRLPNVFTAAADSLAGWLLVRGTLQETGHWVPLVLASACTYAGGIALNDVTDIEVDRVERPGRPLPSGRIPLSVARALAILLLFCGSLFANISGVRYALGVQASLFACVLLYDLGLKRSILGPELMGACRGLNLLLGLCGGEMLGGPAFWLAAFAYATFVTGVTWISRSEVDAGFVRNLVLGTVLQNTAIAVLMAVAFWKSPGISRGLGGVAVLALIALIVGRKTISAILQPSPQLIQISIKTAILSLVWIHVGLLLAVRGPTIAIIFGLLWFPAAFVGRWIYST